MPSKFADIAEQQWNDIPEPKLLPEGTYLLRGTEVLAHLVQDEYVNHAGVPITQNKPTLFEKV